MLNKLTGVSIMLVVVASICLLASVQVGEAFGIISSKRYRADGPAPVIRSFKLHRRVPLPETATSSDSPTSATSKDDSPTKDETTSPTTTSKDDSPTGTSKDEATSTDKPTITSKDDSPTKDETTSTDKPTTTKDDSPTSTSKDKSTDSPTTTSKDDSPTGTSKDETTSTDSPTTTSKGKKNESTSTDTTDSPTITNDTPLPLVGSITSSITEITPEPSPDKSKDKDKDKSTETSTETTPPLDVYTTESSPDKPTETSTDKPTETSTDKSTEKPTDTTTPSVDDTPTPAPVTSNTDSPVQTSSPEEPTPVSTSSNYNSQITTTTQSPTELPSDNNPNANGPTSSSPTDAPSTSILDVPTDIQLPSPQPGVEVTPTTTNTNAPDIIIPSGDVEPPEGSVTIQLKFTTISWTDVINNGILASQIAVVLPQDIGKAIDIPASSVIVLSVNNNDGAVVLKLSIPETSFDDVKSVIENPTSKLYTEGSKLTQYLDTTFPLDPIPNSVAITDPNYGGNSNADISNGSDTPGSSAINDNANAGSGHRALVVVLAVGLSTFLYAGLTALVIRAYRRNKARAGHRQTDYTYGPAIASPMMRETVMT